MYNHAEQPLLQPLWLSPPLDNHRTKGESGGLLNGAKSFPDLGGDQGAVAAIVPLLCSQYGEADVCEKLEMLSRLGGNVDDPKLWLRVALANNFKFMPLERVEKCPCGSRESTLLYRFIFWNLLGLRQCRACGLLFVSPRLAREAVRHVFNEFYFDSSWPEFWGKRRVPIFEDISRWLERLGCKTVFDVGAGFGHFVAWASQRGFKAAGCDLSETCVELGRKQLGVNLYSGTIGDLDLTPASMDCVVSLDTLYYAADPLVDLRAMRQLVKPGGWVILRLRNNGSAANRARFLFKNNTIAKPVFPCEHLWGLTPETTSLLFSLCDLEVRACEPAVYSSTPLSPIHDLYVKLNRTAARLHRHFPTLTRSFNIIGQRKCC